MWFRTAVRKANAPELLELFLIASVTSVLVIRGFLAAAGYPQLGGSGLHIAHMLWGGLFMLLAMVLQFMLMGIVVERTSAVLGGIGFGTFIDELGKFITSDNNYFFHPTIGLIYIIFVALVLLIGALRRRSRFSQQEILANALHRLVDAADGRLDMDSRLRIEQFLASLDQSDPFVQDLRAYLDGTKPEHVSDVRFYFRMKARLVEWYGRLVTRRAFILGFTGIFVFFAVSQALAVAGAIGARVFFGTPLTGQQTFVGIADLASSTVASGLVIIGAFRMPRSRLAAYRWFERAVLVNIFVTQVFRFFASELGAVLGLALNIAVYVALQFMLQREEAMLAKGARERDFLQNAPHLPFHHR